MQASETIEIVEATETRMRGACLIGGCSCKDPRIVSYRRAAFFAAMACAPARPLTGSWPWSPAGASLLLSTGPARQPLTSGRGRCAMDTTHVNDAASPASRLETAAEMTPGPVHTGPLELGIPITERILARLPGPRWVLVTAWVVAVLATPFVLFRSEMADGITDGVRRSRRGGAASRARLCRRPPPPWRRPPRRPRDCSSTGRRAADAGQATSPASRRAVGT